MNDSIVVRQARKSDVMSISQILSQSWKAAFNDFFSPDELSQIASEERFFSILENVIVSNMGELRVATLDDTPVGQVSITADTLLQVNANPDGFTLAYLDWDPEKAEFIQRLADIFSDYVIEAEKLVNAYDYVVSAMKRWYMALPKYAKELKRSVKGQKVDKHYLAMLRLFHLLGQRLKFRSSSKRTLAKFLRTFLRNFCILII